MQCGVGCCSWFCSLATCRRRDCVVVSVVAGDALIATCGRQDGIVAMKMGKASALILYHYLKLIGEDKQTNIRKRQTIRVNYNIDSMIITSVFYT